MGRRNGSAGRSGRLSLEPLESRILLTTLVGTGVESGVSTTFADADGDTLEATFYGPVGSTAVILDPTGADPAAVLSVPARSN